MSAIRGIVRGVLKEARQDAARRQELEEAATALRFAWKLGADKLYKFRSLEGESKAWTLDIIQNSRLYFARPDQFNDPSTAPRHSH